MSKQKLVFLVLAMTVSHTFAADAAEMPDRYRDVQRCMKQSMGDHWQERYGIESVKNRWGVREATQRAIDTAPAVIRINDFRCRRELSLEGEPRP